MRVKTAFPISLDFIKHATNPIKAKSNNASISYICTDTREVQKGDLFIPLSGERFNGENFLADAVSKGAYTLSAVSDSCDIKVSDTSTALFDISSAYKSLFSLKETVAITGSVGKSTTKNLTAEILSSNYRVHATHGNLNNEIGVPLTLLSAPADTEIMVFEAGMNHFGELKRISACIRPTLSAITKIGTAHIGNLGSREGIARAKKEIFDGMKVRKGLIPYGEPLLSGLENTKTVSTALPDSDFYLSVLSQTPSELKFDLFSESVNLKSASVKAQGAHVPECLAFAIAIAISVGMNENEISHAINSLSSPSLFQKIMRVKDLTVIDDSYNASLESIASALKTLSLYTLGKKSVLIGDLLELGRESPRIHRSIGRLCAEAKLSRLFTFGKYAEEAAIGACDAGFNSKNIFINGDISAPDITAEQIARNCSVGETVLFKASNKMRLSRIVELTEKYR